MQLQQYSIELWEEPDTECQHGVSPVRNARLKHPAKTFLASGFASFAILQVTCRSSGGLIIGNKAANVLSLKVEHLQTSQATSADDLIVEGA